MPTKEELLKQAHELAERLGERIDTGKLPKQRLPLKSDLKGDIEAAVATLTTMVESPPANGVDVIVQALDESQRSPAATTTEHDEEAESRERDRLVGKAYACWSTLHERAPDKIPEGVPTTKKAFNDFLDELRSDIVALRKVTNGLSILCDTHAPTVGNATVTFIAENIDARTEADFPADLRAIADRIAEQKRRHMQRAEVRRLDRETGLRLEAALRTAKTRKRAEAIARAAESKSTKGDAVSSENAREDAEPERRDQAEVEQPSQERGERERRERGRRHRNHRTREQQEQTERPSFPPDPEQAREQPAHEQARDRSARQEPPASLDVLADLKASLLELQRSFPENAYAQTIDADELERLEPDQTVVANIQRRIREELERERQQQAQRRAPDRPAGERREQPPGNITLVQWLFGNTWQSIIKSSLIYLFIAAILIGTIVVIVALIGGGSDGPRRPRSTRPSQQSQQELEEALKALDEHGF